MLCIVKLEITSKDFSGQCYSFSNTHHHEDFRISVVINVVLELPAENVIFYQHANRLSTTIYYCNSAVVGAKPFGNPPWALFDMSW